MSDYLSLTWCIADAEVVYGTFLRLREAGQEQSPRCQALGMYFTALMSRISALSDDKAIVSRPVGTTQELDVAITEGQADGRRLEALHQERLEMLKAAKSRMLLELGVRSTSASSR